MAVGTNPVAWERDAAGRFLGYSDADYIMALRRAINIAAPDPLSTRRYRAVRREDDPSAHRTILWANGWRAAVQRAGGPTYDDPHTKHQLDDDKRAISRIDGQVDGPLSEAEYDRQRKAHEPGSSALKRRSKSWNRAKFNAGSSEFTRIDGDHYPMYVYGPVRFLRDAQGRLRMYDAGSVELFVTSKSHSSGYYHRPQLTSAFPTGERPPEALPLCHRREDSTFRFRREDTLFNDSEFCSRCATAEDRGEQ